jgi:hypothetical protein
MNTFLRGFAVGSLFSGLAMGAWAYLTNTPAFHLAAAVFFMLALLSWAFASNVHAPALLRSVDGDMPMPAHALQVELARLQLELTTTQSALQHLETRCTSLFAAIAHGDATHRAWLETAIKAHFAGEPLPKYQPSGAPPTSG